MNDLTDAELEQRARDAIDEGDTNRINELALEMDLRDDERPKPQRNLLGAALWYASVGLKVFPLRPGSKIPYSGTHGCKDATTEAEQVRVWWDAWPESNVAIATGHLVDVIDIDGPDGQRSRVDAWDAIFGRVDQDKVAVVLTPRPAGMHIYVPVTGDGNSAGILKAIDYRGAGGYVVAPPSIISEEYARERDCSAGEYTFLSTPRFDQLNGVA